MRSRNILVFSPTYDDLCKIESLFLQDTKITVVEEEMSYAPDRGRLRSTVAVFCCDYGVEPLQRAKNILGSSVPIVLVTSNDCLEMERQIREIGVFYYLVRPFNVSELKEAIQAGLAFAVQVGKFEKSHKLRKMN